MTEPLPSGVPALRAAWPDPLFLPDLAAVFGAQSTSGARRIVLREGIPYSWIGRRMFVRRAALVAWFEARETVGRVVPPPIPKAPEWAIEILKRRRGKSSAP